MKRVYSSYTAPSKDLPVSLVPATLEIDEPNIKASITYKLEFEANYDSWNGKKASLSIPIKLLQSSFQKQIYHPNAKPVPVPSLKPAQTEEEKDFGFVLLE